MPDQKTNRGCPETGRRIEKFEYKQKKVYQIGGINVRRLSLRFPSFQKHDINLPARLLPETDY